MELDAPVERLPVHHIDEHQADCGTADQPGRGADAGEQRAFRREHAADLPARKAEVAQHAELAPAREHHCAEARRQPKEPHQHRHRLHRISHGKAAIEDAQRQRADLAGIGHVELFAARQRLQRLHQRRRRRARREPDRGVVHPPIAGELGIVRAVYEDRAVLAGVVSEHAGHGERVAAAQ